MANVLAAANYSRFVIAEDPAVEQEAEEASVQERCTIHHYEDK